MLGFGQASNRARQKAARRRRSQGRPPKTNPAQGNRCGIGSTPTPAIAATMRRPTTSSNLQLKQKRRVTPAIKRETRRRSAVELVITSPKVTERQAHICIFIRIELKRSTKAEDFFLLSARVRSSGLIVVPRSWLGSAASIYGRRSGMPRWRSP